MRRSINDIIQQSEDSDHDLRQMALYDLHNELQKESFQLDESKQRQISEICLKALDDKILDVQAMSVKCLPLLLTKMSTKQMNLATVKLSEAMLSDKDEKRDIATVALRSIIAKLPAEKAANPISQSLPGIISSISNASKMEIKLDAMEVLTDIVQRFGSLLKGHHDLLQKLFLKELKSKDSPVRKRSINALAALSMNSSEGLFQNFLQELSALLDSEDSEELRTAMQLLSSTSRLSGNRFGPFLDEFVEKLVVINELISEDETEDEIREYIVQTYESFVSKCQSEAKKHIDMMLIICVEYLQHDPNYSYNSSDEEEVSDGESIDYGESGDEGDYSDDDDISWKVRKAAAKCLVAMVKHHHDLTGLFFKELASLEEHPLISRFKERDEQVKLDIFQVFKELCNSTVTITTTFSGKQIFTQNPEIKHLREILPKVITQVKKQLREKSRKVRLGCFQLLNSLVIALQGGLASYLQVLFPHIKAAIINADDNDTQLKLDVLNFLILAMTYHETNLFQPFISDILKGCSERSRDKYYKVTAESLRVCSVLVDVLAKFENDSALGQNLEQLFEIILEKLKIHDIDQDVKEAAIHAAGKFISQFGSQRTQCAKEALPILVERLKNEITRLVTCRAFETIASGGLKLEKEHLNEIIEELANYLKKFNRPLRQSSLITLKKFVDCYKDTLSTSLTALIIDEVTALVNDSDLHLVFLSLELICSILTIHPTHGKKIQNLVLPKVFELLSSSTLQGNALNSLLEFLKQIESTVGFDNLISQVLKVAQEHPSRQIYTNVGKSIATLCLSSQSRTEKTIAKFSKDLKAKEEKTKTLSLFTLGEIGKVHDLSSAQQLLADIQSNFETDSEEIKNATSYCLGNVAIGNLDVFFPMIIKDIETKEKRKYLLIHSLKYILTESGNEKLKRFTSQLVPILMSNGDNSEEGVRNVVAECLGKLASVNYDEVIPTLMNGLTGTEYQKLTVVSAIKYTVVEKPQPYDLLLKKDILQFLNLLEKSQPVSVRRGCVLLLTSLAHNKGSLIAHSLIHYLPRLYAESVFDPSLERVIDLGPFKHREDDGLELRKSAFECMDTILIAFPNRIEPSNFVAELPHGVNDKNDDIRILSFLILRKVCSLFPEEVLQIVPEMMTPLKKRLLRKLRENALQQEKERHEEFLKAATKAILSIKQIPGIEDIADFQALFNTCSDDPNLSALLKESSTELEGEL